ncbi:hypothetical protein H310_04229 [Aphanomyces invadans]|uniref:Uncharacterized protein n=1 Tax=Aphanomyces invadans TaxID=157072 RepID=A0A024UGC5_9STRA|nr:hypothetical protein H310_04229 [Aphanomyces invadans]ETW05265.1 hypothetical protein H310_04229 [Aphanomyces invadans]|eukprot:XP_008866703.1 hypothetical protein H310_04229 [Aphanomyces invadans]
MEAHPSDSTGVWDGLLDLQFLVDGPSQHGDLLSMWDVVDGDKTGRTCSPPSGKRRRPLRDYHHRAEIRRLREHVEHLKVELARAKAASRQLDQSVWEKSARRERVEKLRSLEENAQLHAAVKERAVFIEHLKRTLYRKPRWTALPDATVDAWQSYKLAAQASVRAASIHAIADRQFRRQPHAFIQAGILDRVDDLFRAESVKLAGHILLQVVNHVNFPAPASTVSAACWRTFSDGSSSDRRNMLPLPDNATETIEVLDAHTIYERFCQTQGDITGHSNNIRKFFKDEDGRDVIVWRTVLDDALVPHMAQDVVDNTWGWMTCLVQIPLDARVAQEIELSYERTRPDQRNDSQTIEAILSAIRSLSRPGPGKSNHKPHDVVLPAMRTFLERGRLFETAMKAALNDAIARFATS